MVSLQEQLMKAGLLDKKKAKKVHHEKRQKNKEAGRAGGTVVDETRLAVLQEQQRNREIVRELNAKRDAEARKKELRAQIRQMVAQSRQSKGGGDIAYNYTFGTKIERIHVSAAVRDQLAAGQLVIVRLDDAVEPGIRGNLPSQDALPGFQIPQYRCGPTVFHDSRKTPFVR